MSAVDTIKSIMDKLNDLQKLAPETPVDRIEYTNTPEPSQEDSTPQASVTMIPVEIKGASSSEGKAVSGSELTSIPPKGNMYMSINYTLSDGTSVSKVFENWDEFCQAVCEVRQNNDLTSYNLSCSESYSNTNASSPVATPTTGDVWVGH